MPRNRASLSPQLTALKKELKSANKMVRQIKADITEQSKKDKADARLQANKAKKSKALAQLNGEESAIGA